MTSSKERQARARVIDKVRKGLRPEQAAAACRVSRATFDEWLTEPEFVLDVLQADAQFVEDNIDRLRAAGEEKPHLWVTSAWLLERTKPDDFAQRVTHTLVSKQLTAAIEVACEVLPRDLAIRLGEAWEARFGVDLGMGHAAAEDAAAPTSTRH